VTTNNQHNEGLPAGTSNASPKKIDCRMVCNREAEPHSRSLVANGTNGTNGTGGTWQGGLTPDSQHNKGLPPSITTAASTPMKWLDHNKAFTNDLTAPNTYGLVSRQGSLTPNSQHHEWLQAGTSTFPPKQPLDHQAAITSDLTASNTNDAASGPGRATSNRMDLAGVVADLLGVDSQEVTASGTLVTLAPEVQLHAGDRHSSGSLTMSLLELERDDASTERSTGQDLAGVELLDWTATQRLAFNQLPVPSTGTPNLAMQAFTESFRQSLVQHPSQAAARLKNAAASPQKPPCVRAQLSKPSPSHPMGMAASILLNCIYNIADYLLPGHLPLRFHSRPTPCVVMATQLPGYPDLHLPLRPTRLCSESCQQTWRRIAGEVLALKAQILAVLSIQGTRARGTVCPNTLLTLPAFEERLRVRSTLLHSFACYSAIQFALNFAHEQCFFMGWSSDSPRDSHAVQFLAGAADGACIGKLELYQAIGHGCIAALSRPSRGQLHVVSPYLQLDTFVLLVRGLEYQCHKRQACCASSDQSC
jgi:hypothetical protein